MADWKWFAIGSAVFAGLTAILAKIGVEHLPSNFATLVRTLVVLVFTALLVGLRHEWPQPGQLPYRSLFFLILSGLATALSWLCYYRALQGGPASMVAPLDKLSLVVTVGLAVFVLGERLTMWQWCGALLMGAGAVLMVI